MKVALLLAVAFVAVLYAPIVFAAEVSIGDFSCSGGSASGELLVSGGDCPTELRIDNVFTFLLCNIEKITSSILGHMYCGMIKELEGPVWALTTLAVIFFAISFTFGLTPATGREAMVFLLKIVFVTGFATNAELIVQYGYTLLIGGMRDGVTTALAGIDIGSPTTEGDAFKKLDEFMLKIFQYATDSMASVPREERCKNAVFAVIATMAAAFPILAYLALLLVGRVLLTFLRAVFGYVYAIVGITFLLILSPIFVPLYLFKHTQHYFNKWVGYLVSFALQTVLLFTFLAFVLSLKVDNMTKNLTSIIMYQEQTAETTSFRMPWQYCTLCSFQVVDSGGQVINDTDREYISKGSLQCKTLPVNVPGSAGFDATKPETDSAGRTPMNLTFSIAPDTGNNEMNSLIILAGQGVLSLIVLAVAISQVMTLLPSLAQRMASGLGGAYVPQLAGGTNAYGAFSGLALPGESLVRGWTGGFKEGMSKSWKASDDFKANSQIHLSGNRGTRYGVDGKTGEVVGRSTSTSGSMADGFRENFTRMITGRNSADNAKLNEASRPGNYSDNRMQSALDDVQQRTQTQGGWRQYLVSPGTRKTPE